MTPYRKGAMDFRRIPSHNPARERSAPEPPDLARSLEDLRVLYRTEPTPEQRISCLLDRMDEIFGLLARYQATQAAIRRRRARRQP